jgi:competence protein ComEC
MLKRSTTWRAICALRRNGSSFAETSITRFWKSRSLRSGDLFWPPAGARSISRLLLTVEHQVACRLPVPTNLRARGLAPGGLFLLFALAIVLVPLRILAAKNLDIWFIDVEGGQSTLIVTPAGESLLIDAGYSPNNRRGGGAKFPGGRDAGRIMAVLEEAGVSRIDYLLITHFHPDHAGGVPLLAEKVPIGTFIDYDHPLGTPLGPDRLTAVAFREYAPVRAKGNHIIARAGDRLPLKSVDAEIVSAGGTLIQKPLRGGGQTNSACRNLEDYPEDGTENYRSIGVVFTFGRFRFFNPGDLSGNTLTRVACPKNLIGPVSAYLISHHGNYDTAVPSVYAALRPRAVIMNNGVDQGGHPDAFRTVHAFPAIDVWQLHRSQNDGVENAPDQFIANSDAGEVTSYALRMTASDTGDFSIANPRTGFSKAYRR